jgi:hypothetical protein
MSEINPKLAVEAYGEARKFEIRGQELRATLAGPLGGILAKKMLFISGEARRISVQEHLARLQEEMDEQWKSFQTAGGGEALQDFINADGISRGISYAGEIPSRPVKPDTSTYLDTLP